MRGLRRTRVAIFLAGRSLVRGNAGVSLMSIAMMTAVFISVMFLPSLLSGAIDALNRQLVGTLTGDLSITPSGGVAIPDSTAYLAQIRATDGVAAATGIRQVGNQISHGSEEVAQAVNAIDPESYAEVFTTPEHLVEGTYLQPDDTEGILLGIGVAGADQERQRTYSISLKTVHAGDTVEVALAGGQTHTFIVRGIYENGFPLSDQGAYITLAAADALIPGTSIVDTLQQTFDALDAVTSAVGEAADQADTLAEGADGVASAVGSLASSARSLAASAAEVGSGADELAASARRTASSAASLADAGRALADSMARAEDAVGAPAVASATDSAQQAGRVAKDAAGLAATCPPTDPAYCPAVAEHATAAAQAAATAADSARATGALSAALSKAGGSAGELASQLQRLSTATAGVANAAGKLVSGTDGVTAGAKRLASAADELQTQAKAVARGADKLASALAQAADTGDAPDQATRDDALARLDSIAAPPGEDSVTRIVIRADPGMDVAVLESALEPVRTGVQFQSPADLAAAIQDQLDTFALIDNIMRVISLLVAAITVLIITYVDLSNRRRQIGIERAIGIRSAAIVGSYVLKSMVTAAAGTILGYLLFRFALVPFVDSHPFQFPSGPVVLEIVPQVTRRNAVILLVVAAVAALLPAVRTVRMRILDAIWGA